MHGTTVKAIEAENNLTTTRIKVGQKLKIPAKTEAARTRDARAAPAPPMPATAAPVTPGTTGRIKRECELRLIPRCGILRH